MSSKLNIEVCYALPEKQSLMCITVESNTSVEQAIVQSGILDTYPDIDLSVNKVGVWNRTCKIDTILKEGDRIEIYRPLIADPKEVRKLRAQKAKEEGRANKVTGGRAVPSTTSPSNTASTKNSPANTSPSDASSSNASPPDASPLNDIPLNESPTKTKPPKSGPTE